MKKLYIISTNIRVDSLSWLYSLLGWLNIRQLTDFDTASLMFKISRQKMPKQTQELFTKCETIHQYNTRSVNSGNLILPKMRTLKGQTSFAFSGAQIWNTLPEYLKRAQSIESFQEKLKQFLLN